MTRLQSSAKNYADLSVLFSPSSITNLIGKNPIKKTRKTIRQSRLLTEMYDESIELSKIFDVAYNILNKHYRSEYIYKNSLINHFLNKKHTLKETVFIPEFTVGESKADIAVFNGTSTVYEIKSELDNTAKLTKQLSCYLSCFDYVYLVTHKILAEKVQKQIDPRVGIIVITNSGKPELFKKAITNKAFINVYSVFSCLRKDEYLWIINQAFNYVPIAPNTKIYSLCRELFGELDPRTAHDLAVKAIVRNRILKETQANLVREASYSLKMLTISRTLNNKQCSSLSNNMKLLAKI
jgi:hypothetical protein